MPWPAQMQTSWERANYAHSFPDCENMGYHRFGMIHRRNDDENILFRSCKRCGLREFSRIEINGDQIIETRLKVSTRDAASTNQHESHFTSQKNVGLDGGS